MKRTWTITFARAHFWSCVRTRLQATAPGFVLLPLLLLAPALSAQVVRGTLTDRITGRPVSGAMAVLLAETGTAVASTLTSEQGHFQLRAPAPGLYRIRAERIGYESQTSSAIPLAAGEQRSYAMAIAVEAISLEGITARGDRRCRVNPRQGLATAQVWEEARKALSTTAWVQRQNALRYQLSLFQRTLEPEHLRIVEEQVETKSGYQAQPFASVPVGALMERGFIHEIGGGAYYDYFAPDAEVLLSDAFLDTHCLRLRKGDGERAGQVGLAFQPIRGRKVPEIQGTLWLDERSALLRELEYRYVNLPWPISTNQAGGRVEFALLPSGALVVRRWSIRMPRLAAAEYEWRRQRLRNIQIQGYGERGGEITRVQTAEGTVMELAERAVLAGEVFDSTRSRPLPGAVVSLAGTPYEAHTDSAGQFRMPDLPEGSYALTFSHPLLDSLPGVQVPSVAVSLRAGQVSQVVLSVPPLQRLLREACPAFVPGDFSDGTVPGAVAGDQLGMTYGVVRDAAGAPVPGARVRLGWSRWDMEFQPRGGGGSSPGADKQHRISLGALVTTKEEPWSAEVVADERGRYVVCRVPVGVPIRAQARTGETASSEITFTLREDVHTQDLVFPGAPIRDSAFLLRDLRVSADYALRRYIPKAKLQPSQ